MALHSVIVMFWKDSPLKSHGQAALEQERCFSGVHGCRQAWASGGGRLPPGNVVKVFCASPVTVKRSAE